MQNFAINTSFPTSDPYRVSGDFALPGGIEPTVTAALRVAHELPSPFTLKYFSRKNIDFIQNKLVSETKKYTGFTIGPQDEGILIEIMVGIYVQDATFDPSNFNASFAKLNKLVVTECMKQILPGARAYALYVRDSSSNYGVGTGRNAETSFARPVLASTKGSRILTGFLPLDRNA